MRSWTPTLSIARAIEVLKRNSRCAFSQVDLSELLSQEASHGQKKQMRLCNQL